MKNIVITALMSTLLFTACKKDDQVAEKTLDQQKIEYQMRQLEIEKQKLAIEKEKIAYEAQKKSDSIVQAKENANIKAAAQPQVVRETKTVYVNQAPKQSSNNGTYANNSSAGNSNSGTQNSNEKKGMSKAAKGTIIGTAGGAAAGAIISKKNRGAGAVIGGIVGGATGYTIGRSKDKKDGRVQ